MIGNDDVDVDQDGIVGRGVMDEYVDVMDDRMGWDQIMLEYYHYNYYCNYYSYDEMDDIDDYNDDGVVAGDNDWYDDDGERALDD